MYTIIHHIKSPYPYCGYCESNATSSPTKEVAYRVDNILQLLDICQSTILDEELSINIIISNEKGNTDYFAKTNIQNITLYRRTTKRKFLDNVQFSTFSNNTE